MVWMMGLRKYGYVAEVPGANGDGYFRYGGGGGPMSTVVHRDLADELRLIGSFDAEACMNCGVCTAVCPLGDRPAAAAALPLRRARPRRPRARRRARPSSRACSAAPARRAARQACTSPRTSACCGTGCWREALMPLPTRDVVGILADNLRLRGSVLPIPARRATRWARELDLPRGGETVLYTGMMYQLIPYIERLVGARAAARRLAARPLQRRWRAAPTGSSTARRSSPARRQRERAEYDRVPDERRAAAAAGRRRVRLPVRGRPLLGRARARPRRGRGRRGARAAGSRGASASTACKEVITIDPHTTTMLRTRLPDARRRLRRARAQLPRGARRARRCPRGPQLSGEVVLHDSCVYARYENVVERAARPARRDGPRGRRAGARREADLVLRRPGRGAVSRQGGGGRREAGRSSCARSRRTA